MSGLFHICWRRTVNVAALNMVVNLKLTVNDAPYSHWRLKVLAWVSHLLSIPLNAEVEKPKAVQ
jgi:hypothetical protein